MRSNLTSTTFRSQLQLYFLGEAFPGPRLGSFTFYGVTSLLSFPSELCITVCYVASVSVMLWLIMVLSVRIRDWTHQFIQSSQAIPEKSLNNYFQSTRRKWFIFPCIGPKPTDCPLGIGFFLSVSLLEIWLPLEEEFPLEGEIRTEAKIFLLLWKCAKQRPLYKLHLFSKAFLWKAWDRGVL